ncbi:MAG TPA: glycosyltransferase family 1 protein, partial [Cytophagaceae bacterium]
MKRPVNIAFDAKRAFNNYTGLGNYSRTLIANLSSFFPQIRCHLFSPKVSHNGRTDFLFDDKNFRIYTAPNFRFFWRSFGIAPILKKEKIDIFHG